MPKLGSDPDMTAIGCESWGPAEELTPNPTGPGSAGCLRQQQLTDGTYSINASAPVVGLGRDVET